MCTNFAAKTLSRCEAKCRIKCGPGKPFGLTNYYFVKLFFKYHQHIILWYLAKAPYPCQQYAWDGLHNIILIFVLIQNVEYSIYRWKSIMLCKLSLAYGCRGPGAFSKSVYLTILFTVINTRILVSKALQEIKELSGI